MMKRTPPLLLLLLAFARSEAWNQGSPSASVAPPVNISVLVWHHHAELRWVHDHVGTLPTHYVVKWQAKGSEEADWHPDWVGVGSEVVVLEDLFPGRTYAARVASVSTQGRAWSKAVVFRTLTPIRCAMSEDYFPLIDEADQHQLCAEEHTDPEASIDPDARKCPPGVTEYLLAGIAAGSTIALVAIAMLGKLQQEPKRTRLSDQCDIDANNLHDHDTFMQELRRPSLSRQDDEGAEIFLPACASTAPDEHRGGERDHGRDSFATPREARGLQDREYDGDEAILERT